MTLESLSVTSLVPHPKSIILPPGIDSKRVSIGVAFAVEYTKGVVLMYSNADQV